MSLVTVLCAQGGGPPGGTVRALAIDPSSPDTVYAETSGGGVFKSTNGGRSWTGSGLTNTTVWALAIDPANPATLYAGTEGGGVFKSTDGGAPPATTISKVSGDNQTGAVGQPLHYQLVAVVTNADSIPVAGVTVNFEVTAGGGAVSPTSVVTGDQGVALSTLTLGPDPGTNTVTATAAGLIGSPLTFTTVVKKVRGQLISD